MTDYRRDALRTIEARSDYHAGLWLDKFLKDDFKGSKDGKSSKEQLVIDVVGMNVPEAYRSFYERWETSLQNICGAGNCRKAHTLGRLAINLGSESVLETSIALHRTYGVPYIPGSALKGLAAHYVMTYLQREERWKKETGDGYRTLFGNTDEAGFINFYDALYVPGTGLYGNPLWKDVITVHHPDYYQGKKPTYAPELKLAPPADWDSPTPIFFLTATGSFLVALSGPPNWVERAFKILGYALAREGIGAKTSSGYGRMLFKEHQESASDNSYAMRKKELLHENPPAGRLRGTVVNVHEGNRYGKVNPAKGGKTIGIHINQITKGDKILHDGQIVEYRIGKFKGNDQAEDVHILLESGQ